MDIYTDKHFDLVIWVKQHRESIVRATTKQNDENHCIEILANH